MSQDSQKQQSQPQPQPQQQQLQPQLGQQQKKRRRRRRRRRRRKEENRRRSERGVKNQIVWGEHSIFFVWNLCWQNFKSTCVCVCGRKEKGKERKKERKKEREREKEKEKERKERFLFLLNSPCHFWTYFSKRNYFEILWLSVVVKENEVLFELMEKRNLPKVLFPFLFFLIIRIMNHYIRYQTYHKILKLFSPLSPPPPKKKNKQIIIIIPK